MSMVRYSISLKGGDIIAASGVIDEQVLPLVSKTVRYIAQKAASEWRGAIDDAKLWSGEKKAYQDSISWEQTGPFKAVVSASYKHAAEIETGRPPYDLKKMLDTSLKVRRTKDGRRFLVIPFRHNTPGNGAHAKAMPQAAYDMAKNLSASSILSTGKRRSGEVTHLSPKTGMQPAAKQSAFLSRIDSKRAATVAKHTYAWGQRLAPAALKSAGLSPADVKKYAGMVKMDTSTPGGSKSSAYMTFRIMMEGKPGWIIPAKPGLYLLRDVAQKIEPKAQEAFKLAMQHLKP